MKINEIIPESMDPQEIQDRQKYVNDLERANDPIAKHVRKYLHDPNRSIDSIERLAAMDYQKAQRARAATSTATDSDNSSHDHDHPRASSSIKQRKPRDFTVGRDKVDSLGRKLQHDRYYRGSPEDTGLGKLQGMAAATMASGMASAADGWNQMVNVKKDHKARREKNLDKARDQIQ